MTRTSCTRTLLAGVVALMACGGGSDTDAAPPAPATPPPAAGVTPTGDTLVVEMVTDGEGNFYRPDSLTARRGDVLRFTLVSGVHNVHFVADSNPGVSALPPTSDMLQLPGQTVDYLVDLPAGATYYFHCDPHALLGMVGHLTVQ